MFKNTKLFHNRIMMNKTNTILYLVLVAISISVVTLALQMAFVTIDTQEEVSQNQVDNESLIEKLRSELETEKNKSQELNEILNITINEYNDLSNAIHKWNSGLLDVPPIPIPKTEILDQKFTVKFILSLDKNQITIEGTVPKTYSVVSGTISSGDLGELFIIYAFTLRSDENGFYKKVIEIDEEDSKWQQDSYTLFMKSGKEYKQLKFSL